MTIDEFINALKEINITLTDIQLKQLDQFYNILIETNKTMNLTRITEQEEVYLKHYYDSLSLNKIINLKKIQTICDIGSGAGFPGIVLKIVFPHLDITLIDSLNKRVNYLNSTIQKLGLKNIRAIHIRAEDMDKKNQFDLVTARAVAILPKLLYMSYPLAKQSGYFIAMKSNIDEELEFIIPYIKENNLPAPEILEFLLPKEESKRTLIKFKKEKELTSRQVNQLKKISEKALQIKKK